MTDSVSSENLNLESVGINDAKEIFYNLSYDELYQHETDPSLEGYDKGIVSEFGAVAVDTGKFTGRSPKDKYIVEDAEHKEKIWWNEGTKPISEEAFDRLYMHTV